MVPLSIMSVREKMRPRRRSGTCVKSTVRLSTLFDPMAMRETPMQSDASSMVGISA